jgi:hypothetical protein
LKGCPSSSRDRHGCVPAETAVAISIARLTVALLAPVVVAVADVVVTVAHRR